MADISRIKKRMRVISADGRQIGMVSRMAGSDKIRLTSLSTSHGYDHLIPIAWVSAVDKYVYLNRGSRFVADNWEKAETPSPRLIARISPFDYAPPALAEGLAAERSKAA